MENEIYIAKEVADTMKSLSSDRQNRAAQAIDSLKGDGWKKSEFFDKSKILRSIRSGDVQVLFSYAPEQHAIIVVNVSPALQQDFALAM